jgi:hypothetical protein
MAQLRVGVELRFDAPSDAALRDLRDAFEGMQGHLATPSQIGYLIRCYRIHGPGTAQLLRRLYWERGSTEALLLALEVASPAWAATEPDEVSVTASPSASEPDPLPAVPTARCSAAPAIRGRCDERRPLLGLRPEAADLVEIGPADMQLGMSDEAVAVAAEGR